MLAFRDITGSLQKLKIGRGHPILAHASLSAIGDLRGGADTVLSALLTTYTTVVMPTFTYKTVVIPETGPEGNAIVYGSGKDTNRMAEVFYPNMPADRLMGRIPEALRNYPMVQRSSHPILSFSGIHAGWALAVQTLEEPLAPIRMLYEQDGWVLLLGVSHTVNTSIHFGERLAGRKQFVRWALTKNGIVECPNFPGCSEGFNAIAPLLKGKIKQVELGNTVVQAIPLALLVDTVKTCIQKNPLALLCSNDACERCKAVREEHGVAFRNELNVSPVSKNGRMRGITY